MEELPAQKFSGNVFGNGRGFGGWKSSAKVRFNQYVDTIEEFNKDASKVGAYNKALMKKCRELIAINNPQKSKKRKSCTQEETDTTELKFTLPPGMTM